MQQCRQNEHQTIHQHGLAVAKKYKDLISGRHSGWRLPEWFSQYEIRLKADQPDESAMELYHEFHDVGKPFCIQIDGEGKQHFPNHAEISASIWRVHFGDGLIANLIQHDMDLHLLKPSTFETFKRYDLAPALLLTALSELHANAQMFGGIESTSFKIKFKNLSKIGDRICQRLY